VRWLNPRRDGQPVSNSDRDRAIGRLDPEAAVLWREQYNFDHHLFFRNLFNDMELYQL
jgi:hypothetical protein